MTWTRMRTWIGRHPVWAIVLGLAAWYLPGMVLIVLPRDVVSAAGSGGLGARVLGALLVGYMLLCPVVLTVWPGVVSCLRARSGLPILAPWRVVLLLWAALAAMAMAPVMVWMAREELGSGVLVVGPLLAVVAGFLAAGWAGWFVALGHLAAEWIGQHKVAKGTWETTAPVAAPPKDRDTTEDER